MTNDAPASRVGARAWMWSGLTALGAIVKSALTGPDGVSWAPGRIMGFVVFIIAQCLVIRVAQWALAHSERLSDLLMVYGATAGFEAAICATAISLVLGMAPADPGGKWWSKDACPPPKI